MMNQTKVISPEEFVREWQLTDSTFNLVDKWGITHNTLATRAKLYRGRGIPLRSHKPGRHPSRKGLPTGPQLDVEALKQLAASLVRPGRPRRYETRLRKRRGFKK